jgi:hypothetical protein
MLSKGTRLRKEEYEEEEDVCNYVHGVETFARS